MIFHISYCPGMTDSHYIDRFVISANFGSLIVMKPVRNAVHRPYGKRSDRSAPAAYGLWDGEIPLAITAS